MQHFLQHLEMQNYGLGIYIAVMTANIVIVTLHQIAVSM